MWSTCRIGRPGNRVEMPSRGQARVGTMAKRNRLRLSCDSVEKLLRLLVSAADLAATLIDAISHIH